MAGKSAEARKKNVIEALNKARAMELHAIYQYMNQHYNLAGMDYGELAANVKLIAIDEMRHAEQFAERIEDLGGQPTAQPADKTILGQDVDAIFPADAGLEDNTIDVYNQLRDVCKENRDTISMRLFEQIIEEEQSHFNYFDNTSEHIRKLGAVFLAKVASTPADTNPPARGFIAAQGGGQGAA